MAEKTGNTEWKITPSGETELTVVIPDGFVIPEGTVAVEPESLARAILEWLEEKKINKGVSCNGVFKCNGLIAK